MFHKDDVKGDGIKDMSDKDILAELAEQGINMHHKTGTKKLVSTLTDVRAGKYKAPAQESGPNDKISTQEKVTIKVTQEPVFTKPTEAALAAKEKHETLTREQKALALSRVIVTPNDPGMANYPGLIFTCGSSKVNKGRMIKKFVPFNNEAGWHVPRIILDTIEQGEYQHFKQVTQTDGTKKMVSQTSRKFNVRYLDPLTKDEMIKLAASQQASKGIGQ